MQTHEHIRRAADFTGRGMWICLALAAAVAAVYWPVLGHEFIEMDDPAYVTRNVHVGAGLTREGIQWAFTTIAGEETYWHPLTWLSHMLDCQLFGLNPVGHHLGNVLFHLGNTLLLFLVLRRMTGAVWRSGLVAALFALHPLQVDTVAWVAERKNVLSAFLGLLTLLAYARYVRRPGAAAYIPVFLLFGLSLMAKPMLVTLPCVMLLLDWWPLGRVLNPELRPAAGGSLRASAWTRVLGEKVPMLLLSVISSLITIVSHEQLAVVATTGQLPWASRLAHAAVSYIRYLRKVIWPDDLAVFYPHPLVWPWWQSAGAVLVLAGLTFLALRPARRQPYLFAGWLWFLGMLVPVIGLVQVGSQSMADRFVYLPIIGLFIAGVWGAAAWMTGRRWPRALLAGVALTVLAGCLVVTSFQLRFWKNTETLFRHALAVTQNNSLAHSTLGAVLVGQGRVPEAMEQLEVALRLDPENPNAHNSLGAALFQLGRLPEAVSQYEAALRLRPKYANAHCNLGSALAELGRLPEAVSHYREALRLRPASSEAHDGLAAVLFQMGEVREAVEHLGEVVRLKPEDADAQYNLGTALFHLGRAPEAIGHCEEALRLDPEHLGACRILAWILATSADSSVRNGARAVELAEKANEVSGGKDAWVLDALAAAYAEAGRFGDAVRMAQAALELAKGVETGEATKQIEERLELYRTGRPYHERRTLSP